MPSNLIKTSRDEDFYVLWSSVVDAPTAWGTRAALTDGRTSWVAAELAPARFERADRNGSSAQWPSEGPDAFGGWNDSGFVYDQQGWLPRARLRSLCARLDSDERVDDLLDPFDDDVECAVCGSLNHSAAADCPVVQTSKMR